MVQCRYKNIIITWKVRVNRGRLPFLLCSSPGTNSVSVPARSNTLSNLRKKYNRKREKNIFFFLLFSIFSTRPECNNTETLLIGPVTAFTVLRSRPCIVENPATRHTGNRFVWGFFGWGGGRGARLRSFFAWMWRYGKKRKIRRRKKKKTSTQ